MAKLPPSTPSPPLPADTRGLRRVAAPDSDDHWLSFVRCCLLESLPSCGRCARVMVRGLRVVFRSSSIPSHARPKHPAEYQPTRETDAQCDLPFVERCHWCVVRQRSNASRSSFISATSSLIVTACCATICWRSSRCSFCMLGIVRVAVCQPNHAVNPIELIAEKNGVQSGMFAAAVPSASIVSMLNRLPMLVDCPR